MVSMEEMLDDRTMKMVANAYDETVYEAMEQGHPMEVAHQEGVTAAAMFLASVADFEDGAARAKVEALGLNHQ